MGVKVGRVKPPDLPVPPHVVGGHPGSLRSRAAGTGCLRLRVRLRCLRAEGRRSLHLRGGDGTDRVHRGQAGQAALEAPLPCRRGYVPSPPRFAPAATGSRGFWWHQPRFLVATQKRVKMVATGQNQVVPGPQFCCRDEAAIESSRRFQVFSAAPPRWPTWRQWPWPPPSAGAGAPGLPASGGSATRGRNSSTSRVTSTTPAPWRRRCQCL